MWWDDMEHMIGGRAKMEEMGKAGRVLFLEAPKIS